MPYIEYELRKGDVFRGRCTNTFEPRLAIGGRTSANTCEMCVTPVAAPSNTCRTTWTPDASQVYWSSLPSWTGNVNLTYPTTAVMGNGVWAGGDPFAYTVTGSNLTFDNASLISGPQWINTDLTSFTADNPGPIAWIMEGNPCQERQTRDHTISYEHELGTTSYTIPSDLNDVHAKDVATRVAYGPTVALKIVETIYYWSSLSWLGSPGFPASNHSITIGVTMTSIIAERWCVVARSSGGTFGQPLVLTFSIEDVVSAVGPNHSYQLYTNMAWVDAAALPSVYTGASGDLSRAVTGGGPVTPHIGPFQNLGGVYRRAIDSPTAVILNEGTLDGDDPGNILWGRNPQE